MYTRHDLAALMGEALGRPVTAQSPDFESWAGGVGMADGPLRRGLKTMTAHYDEHGFHGGNALVLETLLGRRPTTVPDFIEELSRS